MISQSAERCCISRNQRQTCGHYYLILINNLLQSVAEFLKGLPSYNENNFTKFHVDNNNRSPSKRPSVYIPTKDYPSEQGMYILYVGSCFNNCIISLFSNSNWKN